MRHQHVAVALQAADDMARRLANEGSANFSTPAQLFAGFLTQTTAILAAWQHGKRFRFALKRKVQHMPYNRCMVQHDRVFSPPPAAAEALGGGSPVLKPLLSSTLHSQMQSLTSL